MRRTKPAVHIFLLVTISLALSACASETDTPQASPSFETIILRDVHALWGGREVKLHSDGALDVRVVAPGGEESRYTARLSPARVIELSNLLEAHRFATIQPPQERAPVPDEARPEIEVVWQSGERTVVAKWANDVHPDFDAIYNWLLQVSDEAIGEGE